MKAFLLLIVVCVWTVGAVPMDFTDCGSTVSDIEADIVPCEVKRNGACSLERNATTTFTIKFTTPDEEIATVNHSVHGQVLGTKMEFRDVRGLACDSMSPQPCPLAPNTRHTYRKEFTIRKGYPLMAVPVEYKLLKADGTKLVCIVVKTRITDRNARRSRPYRG